MDKTLATIGIAGSLLLGGLVVTDPLKTENTPIEITAEKLLEAKEVDDVRFDTKTGTSKNLGKIIAYSYISNEVVSKKPGEIIEKRKSNALFFEKGKNKNGKQIIEAHFYPSSQFKKETDGNWYQIQSATTTTVAFNKIKGFHLIKEAFATNLPSNAGGDGMAYKAPGAGTFAGSRAADGNQLDNSSNSALVLTSTDNQYYLSRSFFPVDTSSIGAGTVTSASFFFKILTDRFDSSNDASNSFIDLIQTTQQNSTSLAMSDYQRGTGETLGATHVRILDLSTSAYNEYTLNSSGLSWINTSGYTLFGFREGHDTNNVSPGTAGSGKYNYVYIMTTEQTGTSNDPYLSVTYTEAGGATVVPNQPRIMFE
jgi:hypothetical protein